MVKGAVVVDVMVYTKRAIVVNAVVVVDVVVLS